MPLYGRVSVLIETAGLSISGTYEARDYYLPIGSSEQSAAARPHSQRYTSPSSGSVTSPTC